MEALPHPVRRRAELFYQQLDSLQRLRRQARKDLLAESRRKEATKLLRQIPYIGPIRAALLVAMIQTPHGFRTKRQMARLTLARKIATITLLVWKKGVCFDAGQLKWQESV